MHFWLAISPNTEYNIRNVTNDMIKIMLNEEASKYLFKTTLSNNTILRMRTFLCNDLKYNEFWLVEVT